MTISNAKGRWPIYLGIAAVLILLTGTFHQTRHRLPESTQDLWPFKDARPVEAPDTVHGQVVGSGQMESQAEDLPENSPFQDTGSGLINVSISQMQSGPPLMQKELSFYEIAIKHGTDKVTDHSYQDMYELYLPALRHKRIKMLEIGLGCDMTYGPGASYHLWLEYFTNIDLYFLEYDASCAAQWAHKTTGATIITGDQGDGVTLDRLIAEYGGNFDIIIDDGGHTMVQQQTSIEHLWKAIKPGGVYFCEDLQTSYWERYGGGAAAVAANAITMVQYIQLMIEDLTWGPRRVVFPQAEEIVRIDCSRELCSFWRRATPTIGV